MTGALRVNIHVLILNADIATGKVYFFNQKVLTFLFFHNNIYYGTHQKHLGVALLMSAHKICFHAEIRKKLLFFDENTDCGYHNICFCENKNIWIPTFIYSYTLSLNKSI